MGGLSAVSRNQFDLFGGNSDDGELAPPLGAAAENAPARKTRRTAGESKVQSMAADEDLAQFARSLPVGAHLGTSSWSFPGWAGLVYADSHSDQMLARKGLAAYAAHPLFRTVSLDRTFYAPIAESDYRSYAAQARSTNALFRFVVKAPMLFTGPRLRSDDGRWTDNPAFLDAGLAAAQFVFPETQGLAETCGPLVFQFPPMGPRFTKAPQRFADALAEFLLALPKLSGPAVYAVELRDPELLTEDYLAALCAGGATHCIGIHARMPQAEAQGRFWREAGHLPLVIRWSLHSGLKYEEAKERYAPFSVLVDEDPLGRAQVAALMLEAAASRQQSFVVANNKAEGSAPLTIRKLSELIAEYGETIVRNG